jgi:hypothetical protein
VKSSGEANQQATIHSSRTMKSLLLSLLALCCLIPAAFADGGEPQIRKKVSCAKLEDGNYVWGCSRAYSMCANGVEYKAKCQPNLVLNPDTNQCQSQRETPICKLADERLYKAKDPFSCSNAPENGLYEAGPCSNFYISCNDGQRHDLECPSGTVFIEATQQCDHQQDCKKRVASKKPGEGLTVVEFGPNGEITTSVIGADSNDQGTQSTPTSAASTPPPSSLTPTPPRSAKSSKTNITGSQAPSNTSSPGYNPRRMGGSRRGGPYLDMHVTMTDSFSQPSEEGPPIQPHAATVHNQSPQEPAKPGVTAYNQQPQVSVSVVAPTYGLPAPAAPIPAGSVYTQQPQAPSNQVAPTYGLPAPVASNVAAAPVYVQQAPVPVNPAAPVYVQSQQPAMPSTRADTGEDQPPPQSAASAGSAAQTPLVAGEYSCAGKHNGVYPAQTGACSDSFWKCSNGYAHKYNCTAGLFYNIDNNQCDLRQFIVACGGTPAPPTAAPPVYPSQQVQPPVNFNCLGKRDGYYAQPSCQPNYVSCASGIATGLSCGPGTVYDVTTRACEYPETCGQPKQTSTPSSLQQAPAPSASGHYGRPTSTPAMASQPPPTAPTPASPYGAAPSPIEQQVQAPTAYSAPVSAPAPSPATPQLAPVPSPNANYGSYSSQGGYGQTAVTSPPQQAPPPPPPP